MYYIISILLIITAIGLAIYGSKKYNVSLALAYVIPNLAFLYYIDDALNGSSYIKYGYYTVLFFGVLVLLFAKIFTYIYSYFTLLFLLVLIWASSYSILNLNTENIGSIEAWSIILIALIVIILVRKSIKSIVIGMGSGYMLGIGIAALGFKSILNMGWGYIMDAIYFPGLTILIFTIAGIFYQFYLAKSEKENPDLSKKQVNLYFGAGSGLIAILLILLPLLLKTTPEKSAKKLAKAYCECVEDISEYNNQTNIEDLCKNEIGFYSSLKSISGLDDIQIFSTVFAKEISKCLEDAAKNLNSNIDLSDTTTPETNATTTKGNLSNSIKLNGTYSQITFGVHLGSKMLKFDGNIVNYSIFSMHIQGAIIDAQKTSGTYKIYGEGDNLTLELNFNTKTISLKYLTTGAYNDGYSYRDVILPHILKLSKDSSGNYNIVGWEKDEDDESEDTQNKNYNKFLGRYIGDFGMDTAILAIENIDAQNGLATGYIKNLGEYEDSQNLKGPFKIINDNTDLRIALSNNYTTYDFYVDGKTVKGDAKDKNGETMYSFSLSKMENSSSNKLAEKTYYTIQDVDGYSNLRNKPNGEILRRVYVSEKFEIIGSEENYKKVKLNDGTLGYIHESRVVKSVNYRVNLNTGVTNVNVRDNYGTENTKVIDQISYPMTLTVIKEQYLNSEKWIYIKEKNGWILSDFVQNNGSANQNDQTVLLQTTKYKIRIDKLGNDNYTYTAWPALSSMDDTPNIVIKNGKRHEDGSGGNHYYTFMNGVYKYECWINVLGTDETPPANLLVYKKNDLILNEDALIK